MTNTDLPFDPFASTEPIPGSESIAPGDNLNWVFLDPHDVRRSKYDLLGNGVSEYYYFIKGEFIRNSEKELIQTSKTPKDLEENQENLDILKEEKYSASLQEAKDASWNILLEYLDKQKTDTDDAKAGFEPIATKLTLNSLNPKNQKVLFVIKANDVDALPKSSKHYVVNFPDDSAFLAGKEYAVTLRVKEIKVICDYLTGLFQDLKTSAKSSNLLVRDIKTNLNYDFDAQIKSIHKVRNAIDNFMARQSIPYTSNTSQTNTQASQGTKTEHEHFIRVGVRDNNKVGSGVKQTISYILFSPDPETVQGSNDNLIEFGHFIPSEFKTDQGRVAKPLRYALPLLRKRLEGVYNNRTLHLILSYYDLRKSVSTGKTNQQNKWAEFLSNYLVPPVKIFMSGDPQESMPAAITAELDQKIKNLDKKPSSLTQQQKSSQEEFYKDPEYMASFFEKYNFDGTVTMNNETLQDISGQLQNVNDEKYMENLFKSFFHRINLQSLISLIMICMQNKLGLPLTAEAMCEAAMLNITEKMGLDEVEKLLERGAIEMGPEIADKVSNLINDKIGQNLLQYTEGNAPITMAILLKEELSEQLGNDIIMIIKFLETNKKIIKLIPAQSTSLGGQWPQATIDFETERYKELGYSESQAQAQLVLDGYSVPDPIQYMPYLNDEYLLSQVRYSQSTESGYDTKPSKRQMQEWLDNFKEELGLDVMCELFTNSILGVIDFVKDLSQFTIPWFTFPDNLPTDNLLGDRAEQFAKLIATIQVAIFSQIANLLIQQALNACMEEDDDSGPATGSGQANSIPIPPMPKIGACSSQQVAAWAKDIFDNLTIGQMKAFCRNEASQKTLLDALERTKLKHPCIYENGIVSTEDIATALKGVCDKINIDFDGLMKPMEPLIDDTCESIYNSEEKKNQLMQSGLTLEEAEEQIQREIDDLKSKILGLAGLGLSTGEMSSNSLLPSMCADFQLPEAVEDSMTRLTDLFLNNVKRSLIQDMSSLKFFSVPPRAVLAATDPEELRAAHQMFVEAISDPYTKRCFAYIGDPLLLDHISSNIEIPVLPITYNSFVHYGDFLTRYSPWYGEAAEFSPAEATEDDYSLLKNVMSTMVNISDNGILDPPGEAFFKKDALTPINVSNVDLYDYGYTPGWPGFGNAKNEWPTLLPLWTQFNTQFAAMPGYYVERKTKIKEDLESVIKPMYLDKIVFEAGHLTLATGGQDLVGLPLPARNPNDSTNIPNLTACAPADIATPPGTDPRSLLLSHLAMPWPLTATLRQICPDPNAWYVMARHFTGLALSPLNGYDFSDPDAGTPVNWSDNPGLIRLGPNPTYPVSTPEDFIFWTLPPCVEYGPAAPDLYVDHRIVDKFMDLTVREALGLENKRIRRIFPNFPALFHVEDNSVQVYFTRWRQKLSAALIEGETAAVEYQQPVKAASSEDGAQMSGPTWFWPEQILPLYLVFDQAFRDPDQVANSEDPKEVIKHFSMYDKPTNAELYNSFSRFPQALGYTNDSSVLADTALSLESDANFNPNILFYDLPFTNIRPNVPDINGAATGQILAEIMNELQQASVDASEDGEDKGLLADALQAAADAVQVIQQNDSIIYQNLAPFPLGLNQNILSQLDAPRDIFKFSKAKYLAENSNWEVPPNPITSDSAITRNAPNFDFALELPEDVKNLIMQCYTSDLDYDSTKPFSANASNIFEQNYTEVETPLLQVPDASGAYNLNKFNTKAQIFAMLLATKFMQKFNETDGDENALHTNSFLRKLKYILSTYGYSALQYAYSNQMFSKLKHSRLHKRKFMNKLWKKILRNPYNKSASNPNCVSTAEAVGEKTQTDFFDLEQIKPEIIKFYKTSVCRNMYDRSPDQGEDTDLNAPKIALIEGAVILIIKIYALEVCLSGIIAWDSFDASDILKSEIVLKNIVKNIKEDFDINVLAYFASDIIKKDKNYSDKELMEFNDTQSGLQYLLAVEADKISKIIKDVFINSSPISTDLQLNIKNKILTGTPYVSDVHFKNNIYTMNYGHGRQENNPIAVNFLLEAGPVESQEASGPNHRQWLNQEANLQHDLFGYFDVAASPAYRNKELFHSLPVNNLDTSWPDGFFALPEPPGYPYPPPLAHEHFVDYCNAVPGSGAFNKEVYRELLPGNHLNFKLGNVTIQPYVKIQFLSSAERESIISIYMTEGADGELCAAPQGVDYDISNANSLFEELEDLIRKAGRELFSCYIGGYIPLSVWSYIFNAVFLKEITAIGIDDAPAFSNTPPLKYIYDVLGLSPFFKDIRFGLRMSYSTSYPITQIDDKFFSDTMASAFSENSEGLTKIKTLQNKRYYSTHKPAVFQGPGAELEKAYYDELEIPIVEIERQIISDNGSTFQIGEQSYDLEGLGYWAENIDFTEPLSLDTKKHVLNNFHQFYYKYVAQDLVDDLKTSPEFKLMYDHLFPMKRYMATAFSYAASGMSRFISNPDDILDTTKLSLKSILKGFQNSDDYKYVPDEVANQLSNLVRDLESGTQGKEPDLSKQLLEIILKTPLLILKGFVEVTDPAVIIAKLIIDVANMVITTTITIVESSMNMGLQGAQTAMASARTVIAQTSIDVKIKTQLLKTYASMLPPDLQSEVEIDDASQEIGDYSFSYPDADPAGISGSDLSAWQDIKARIDELNDVLSDYNEATESLQESQDEKDLVEKTFGKILNGDPECPNYPDECKGIKREFREIFQSPFLLPGLWFGMLPSMLPFGGGIVPPPFFAGPPSTVPGMIYIALLLIDAIEEELNDDIMGDPDEDSSSDICLTEL